MRSKGRGVDRCEFSAASIPFSAHLAAINRQDQLAAYFASGRAAWHASVAGAVIARPLCAPNTPQTPVIAPSLPTIGNVTPTALVGEDVRFTVAYQISVPTTRGALFDLIV